MIAVGQTEAKLISLRAEVDDGSRLEAVQVNLGDWNDTQQKLADHCESVDFLVNNAGYAHCCRVEDQTLSELNKMIDVNLKAPMNLIRMVAPGMKARKFGSIVNVSSIAALIGLEEHVAYGATKAGLDMVTKVCAKELAPYNIRVNSVNPTVVWTDLAKRHWGDPVNKATMIGKIPTGRFVEISEVVQPIIHLLSEGSAMINGITLPIDGGLTTTR